MVGARQQLESDGIREWQRDSLLDPALDEVEDRGPRFGVANLPAQLRGFRPQPPAVREVEDLAREPNQPALERFVEAHDLAVALGHQRDDVLARRDGDHAQGPCGTNRVEHARVDEVLDRFAAGQECHHGRPRRRGFNHVRRGC
ncbi:MAG TPA: hypothetical protein VGF94_27630 [Kofleriaceae bacterium]